MPRCRRATEVMAAIVGSEVQRAVRSGPVPSQPRPGRLMSMAMAFYCIKECMVVKVVVVRRGVGVGFFGGFLCCFVELAIGTRRLGRKSGTGQHGAPSLIGYSTGKTAPFVSQVDGEMTGEPGQNLSGRNKPGDETQVEVIRSAGLEGPEHRAKGARSVPCAVSEDGPEQWKRITVCN
jgi:hypothetical protein